MPHAKYSIWDLFFFLSIIGIWPRYIEPKLLGTKKLRINIPQLPADLTGLRIIQLSDLHLNHFLSDHFLSKIIQRSKAFKPDLILFTGDFLCDGKLQNPDRLKKFLNTFDAPLGCYAVLGNHDYSEGISVNEEGDYDIRNSRNSPFFDGLKRLFKKPYLTKKRTEALNSVGLNEPLLELLQQTPFKLLNNQTIQVEVGSAAFNLTGLGEHMLGQALPEQAFQNYDPKLPGIVLAHNPDAFPHLEHYPGDLVLSGHTHGGQVFLPWIWRKLTIIENPRFRYGLFRENHKTLFVSRGLGGLLPFRLFSKPEIVCMELESC